MASSSMSQAKWRLTSRRADCPSECLSTANWSTTAQQHVKHDKRRVIEHHEYRLRRARHARDVSPIQRLCSAVSKGADCRTEGGGFESRILFGRRHGRAAVMLDKPSGGVAF